MAKACSWIQRCFGGEARRPSRCHSGANPNGIVSSSPGLRGTSYPGGDCKKVTNPERVDPCEPATRPRWGRVGVENDFALQICTLVASISHINEAVSRA